MPIVVKGETYMTGAEAARYIGVSRPTFYNNIQSRLTEYRHGAFKRVYYRKADLERFRDMKEIEE